MKILICSLFFAACVSSNAQEHFDVTVQDANQIPPDATHRQIQDWLKRQIIQYAVSSALQQQPQAAQTAPALSPQQIQAFKLLAIQVSILGDLIQNHPNLKPESDAMYVQCVPKVTQMMSQNTTLPVAEQQVITSLMIRAMVCSNLIANHPELKPESDALYVQYDTQFSQKLINSQQPTQ